MKALEIIGLTAENQATLRMSLPFGATYRDFWDEGALAAMRALVAEGEKRCEIPAVHHDLLQHTNRQCGQWWHELKAALEKNDE